MKIEKIKIVKYNFWLLGILFSLFLLFNFSMNKANNSWFNIYLSVIWSLSLPIVLLSIFVLFKKKVVIEPFFEGRLKQRVIFEIPTIGKKHVVAGLERVLNSIQLNAPKYLDNFKIVVVTEEENDLEKLMVKLKYSNVEFLIVPKKFQTKNDTKYKARANEYTRKVLKKRGEIGKDIWIYHLDDDTAVNELTIKSIACFINENKYYMGQGFLGFPLNNSKSLVCKLADSIRTISDLTEFRFFSDIIHTPYLGLHGEHLLIRSDIENKIGWDFGSVLVEDAYFGLNFCKKYPKKHGFLLSPSLGSSPQTIKDFITQRKRWVKGLIKLVFDKRFSLKIRSVLIARMFLWVISLLQLVWFVGIIALIFDFINFSPFLKSILVIWSLTISFSLWSYFEGLKINSNLSNRKNKSRKNYVITVVLFLTSFFALIESIATILAIKELILKNDKGFEVITKK